MGRKKDLERDLKDARTDKEFWKKEAAFSNEKAQAARTRVRDLQKRTERAENALRAEGYTYSFPVDAWVKPAPEPRVLSVVVTVDSFGSWTRVDPWDYAISKAVSQLLRKTADLDVDTSTIKITRRKSNDYGELSSVHASITERRGPDRVISPKDNISLQDFVDARW